ncbi:MAG TPA: hypothetical protein DDX39_12615 [Bacteroidales bacterium]|nr:MAG: hypothetical protein A2W98_06400 [Bacteroidetes bacterium GWF2_33_38]OFY74750.1 MAG: hypothetical protein A2265_09245 [Bacteroidetes bacterium RIFOXYA12_FULL_33_9]OFY89309.1 MAG: hypothetical protein A2236_08240 [Bacteroidetes bacterium RIFOXYA2_FULL_33_7]HBF89475.1 hypothetical protein [Bacteroidales bacterium]
MLFDKFFFDATQVVLLVLTAIFFFSSLYFQLIKKESHSLLFVGLMAFSIFSFGALLDPFLNLWDERFHALVAKNMMNHPLMPTLYENPIVNMAYDRWDRSFIWIHKQPLFLWQISLSFKLFGISEFTLRLPSVILATILALITYRSGKLLVNGRVGYISSILMVSTIYITELVAGRQELDHNDISFLTYISLSIWSFLEYCFTKNKIWIYLIGLFSGMAILCKWLVGLLIYLGWLVLKILERNFKFSESKDFIISFLITLLVAVPWQILTFIWYPIEAEQIQKFNAIHFTVVTEGHGGTFWFHFEKFKYIYGLTMYLLIIPAFIVLYKRIKDKKLFFSLFSMVFFVYLFFTLAASKMPSFTIIVSMIIFIVFASLIDEILNQIEKRIRIKNINILIFVALMLIIVFSRFDLRILQEKHTVSDKENLYVEMLSHNKKIFKTINFNDNYVLFNVKGRHYIEAMFYTGLSSYNFVPSIEQYKDLKEKGKNIAIFNSMNLVIPDYLSNDSTTILIDEEILGYE